MSYIPLPNKEGWWIEAETSDGRKYSKAYLKSEIKTKEDAKKQLFIDTGVEDDFFKKIEISEAII